MSHGASFLKKLDEFATDISLFISAGVVEPLEKNVVAGSFWRSRHTQIGVG
jgi:hypothetical protein